MPQCEIIVVEKFGAFSNADEWPSLEFDKPRRLPNGSESASAPQPHPEGSNVPILVAKLYSDEFQGCFVVSTVSVTLATLHAVCLWFV